MACQAVVASVDTSTRLHRENTLRQFNYSLPLGFNVMGNWVPFTFNVLLTPTSGYTAIVSAVPDDNCWFYAQNINEYVCHNTVTAWYNFMKEVEDPCDAYVDSKGNRHTPKYTKLFEGLTNLFDFDIKRTCYSGQRFYKAPQKLLPDGSVCRPECWGSWKDKYEPEDRLVYTPQGYQASTTADTANSLNYAIPPVHTTTQNTTSVKKINRAVKRATSGCSSCGRRK